MLAAKMDSRNYFIIACNEVFIRCSSGVFELPNTGLRQNVQYKYNQRGVLCSKTFSLKLLCFLIKQQAVDVFELVHVNLRSLC